MRTVLLATALAAFVAMSVAAIRSFPTEDTGDINWPLLATIGIAGPTLTIWLNAAEFDAQARLLAVHVSRAAALRVSVLGTAANLLPLPGAVLVRTQALARDGVGYAAAGGIAVVAAITWLGATAFAAGLGVLLLGGFVIGPLCVATGVVLCVVGLLLCQRFPGGTVRAWTLLFAVELGLTVMAALRLLVILIALGLDVEPGQALAMTIAGALASATGIFPAGLGLREALTALVASLVSLDAAAGFAAAAADRIAGLVVLFVASAAIIAVRRFGQPATASYNSTPPPSGVLERSTSSTPSDSRRSRIASRSSGDSQPGNPSL